MFRLIGTHYYSQKFKKKVLKLNDFEILIQQYKELYYGNQVLLLLFNYFRATKKCIEIAVS